MIFHYQKIEIVGDWMLLLLLLLLTFSPCVYLFRMASNVTARGMNPGEIPVWMAEWDRTCQAPFCRKTLVGLDGVYRTPQFTDAGIPNYRMYCCRFCAKTDWDDWYDVCQETGREYVGLASDSSSESEVWRVFECVYVYVYV
jgi:hypothetical protein